ncbi:uncharacterized protein LOC133201749 [Saccostrea echinata]|uniref:uncharacterized protein LOC133201749 n=1 Tax=Saccostrea echinata TaxID=191078 RepID=UPI002A840760|nr:uncharacterized protein LOC133201749 [Saccostrea echinata]
MVYLLLVTLLSILGTFAKGCTHTEIINCFMQPSLLNYTHKINSPNILRILKAQDTVEEYCSITKGLTSCLQDVKTTCLSTNRITLSIDMALSLINYLCSEGKRDFIDHFQCVILDHIQNETSFKSCQKDMLDLFDSFIEAQRSGNNNYGKICRAANKIVTCMEEEGKRVCSDEASKVMRTKTEAAIQPLMKDISCENKTLLHVHGCNKDGFSNCLIQSSLPDFIKEIRLMNNSKILNAQETVDEYCSIIRKPSHCLEDIKTTCHFTNSISLDIDIMLSAENFLCSVGRQGFVKNFQCVMYDLLLNKGLDFCTKTYMAKLTRNIIEADASGSGISSKVSENLCRAANETFSCFQEKSRTLCGEEAGAFTNAYFEAKIRPLMSNITCENGYSPRKYLSNVYMDQHGESSSTITSPTLGNNCFFILIQTFVWAFTTDISLQ